MLIAAALGAGIGLLWPDSAAALEPVSVVFLRLVKSIIAPLILATLTVGVGRGSDLQSVSRISGKAAVLFAVLSGMAILIGYGAAELTQPGAGVVSPAAHEHPVKTPDLASTLESLAPASIIDAMARGDVLQIVTFSIFFGAACAAAGKRAAPILVLLDAVGSVMMRYTRYVMRLAPLGVLSAMAASTARTGPQVIYSLAKYALTFVAAELTLVTVIVLPLALYARLPLTGFLRAVRSPVALAFSTASSQAALPLALKEMDRLGVPKQIAAFVLPAGMSFNLAGTTLFLALASAFVIQSAGVQLTFEQAAIMLLTLAVTSKGVAAVPRASYVILTGTVASVGVPAEAAAIVLGIDATLDMLRTGVTCSGTVSRPPSWRDGKGRHSAPNRPSPSATAP